MYLKTAIFINRAPFEELRLDFEDETISILSGINGAGKTTILSHIVDAMYEIAKRHFVSEFENINNKYYRISSSLFSINQNKTSIVYLRFVENNKNIDYVDIRELPTEQEYNQHIQIEGAIPYSTIKNEFNVNKRNIKYSTIQENKVQDIFFNNIMTYFPAYRYEQPSYLNDPYNISLKFQMDTGFAGYLPNPIEVTSDLENISNWIMDIVLDAALYKKDIKLPLEEIQNIFAALLSLKTKSNVRIGIGPRHKGAARIQVIDTDSGACVYPSIFNMSSGELSLLCIFGELLKQSDKLNKTFTDITGIVLIDEVDKHLHIKMQVEVLPKLMAIFPKLQFIVTSHTPFLHIGLCHDTERKTKVYDIDNNGLICDLACNPMFKEAFDSVVDEKENFLHKYQALTEQIKTTQKPLIITEGKTDWKHLQKALTVLGIPDLDIEFHNVTDSWGNSSLWNALENLALIKQPRKIIGIFDRDDECYLKKLDSENSEYKEFGNNVFAFAIPIVNEDIYGKYISIEHYYSRAHLTKMDAQQRRIFLGDEFYESGNSKDGNYQTKIDGIKNRVEKNSIIDKKVFEKSDLEQKTSIALSKNDFAEYVLNDDMFTEDFNFENFHNIFEIIKNIISI